MLGLDTQYSFVDFLRQIAERELDIERQRQILGEIQEFEPYASFCRLNRHEDKRITADEIFNFLQQNGVNHLTERDCGRVITYFDSDNDNGLNYKEWMEVLLPCDDLYMRSVITQRPSYDCPRHMNLTFTIEKQIALLLKLEIEMHLHLETLKHALKRRLDWSNMRAFQTIDNRGEGFLNYNNIMNFCRMNSYRASESEIIAVVRRLDIDADQRISFQEWDDTMNEQQELAPAIHGNPSDQQRQDPFFRHTSPTKSLQNRSPARSVFQPEQVSPQRIHQAAQLVRASNHARDTREDYASRQRESPLRGSPQRYEAARQAASRQAPNAYPQPAADHSIGIRNSIQGGRSNSPTIRASIAGHSPSPTRRPDSPLRQKSSPRMPAAAQSAAVVRRAQQSPLRAAAIQEHESIHTNCTRASGFGMSRTGYGQPRAMVTQTLMKNSAAKQYRQSDYVDELPQESIARYNQNVYSSRDARTNTDGAQMSNGVTGTAPRRHNLPFDEEEELIAALREYVRLELELEEAKMRLAQQPDFNLMDAYQMLDKFSKGWVTAPEMIESLGDLGAYPHKDDVYLVVRRYDKDGDGRILYSDFCDAFTPTDLTTAEAMQRRPAYHIQHGYCRTHFFMVETRNMFLATFRMHFTIEEQAELLRKRLSRRPNFNVHEAFQAIDLDSNGYISKNELRRILAENGVFASERDLHFLIGRFDRNNDGRISYAEFMEEMIPKTTAK